MRKKATPLFEQQMTKIVGAIQALNQQTAAAMQQRFQYKDQLERAQTRLSQWEPLADEKLVVVMVQSEQSVSLSSTESSESLAAWQVTCTRHARAGIRLMKNNSHTWHISLDNGNGVIVETQMILDDSLEEKSEWDLRPLRDSLRGSLPTPESAAIRRACQAICQQQQSVLKHIQSQLSESESTLKRLAKQRQTQLLTQTGTLSAWHELDEKHPLFLHGLLEVNLRQQVIKQLPWGQLPAGKGVQQLLRLLELGRLSELNLQDCSDLTDATLIACLQNSPDLLYLNISGCIQLTSRAVMQCASSNQSLLRLSARSLPRLTDLWNGVVWLTRTALVFPRLTHADFRDCVYLTKIQIYAPELQYLHLGACGLAAGSMLNTQDWTLLTPKLTTLYLQGCRLLRQMMVDSQQLKHIDARDAGITVPLLQAMLTPEQWCRIQVLHLPDSEAMTPWQRLSTYPFLIPLADEIMSATKLLALHSVLSHPKIAAAMENLSIAGHLRLQAGLALFLWQQGREFWTPTRVKKYLTGLEHARKNNYVVREHLTVWKQIETIDPALIPAEIGVQLQKLEEREESVSVEVKASEEESAEMEESEEESGSPPTRHRASLSHETPRKEEKTLAPPIPAYKRLSICLFLLEKEGKRIDYYKKIIMEIGDIGATHRSLAKQAFEACLSQLEKWSGALEALEKIIAAHPDLAAQALAACPEYKFNGLLHRYYLLHHCQDYIPRFGLPASFIYHISVDLKAPLIIVKYMDIIPLDKIEVIFKACLLGVTSCYYFSRREFSESDETVKRKEKMVEPEIAKILSIIKKMVTFTPVLAQKAFVACLTEQLKDIRNLEQGWLHSSELVKPISTAIFVAIRKIGASLSTLSEPALTVCLSVLNDYEHICYYGTGSNTVHVIESVEVTMGAIGAANPDLAFQIFELCLGRLTNSKCCSARTVEAVALIGAAIPALANQALKACLSKLKSRELSIQTAAIRAVGKIGVANPVLTYQAFQACLFMLQNSHPWVRQHAVEATGKLGKVNTDLARRAVKACLPRIQDWLSSHFIEDYYGIVRVREAAIAATMRHLDVLPPELLDEIFEAYISQFTEGLSGGRYQVVYDAAVAALKRISLLNLKLATRTLAVFLSMPSSYHRNNHQLLYNVITTYPQLVYTLLKKMPYFLQQDNLCFQADAINLLLSVSVAYGMQIRQDLGGYINAFLQQRLGNHPEEKSPTEEKSSRSLTPDVLEIKPPVHSSSSPLSSSDQKCRALPAPHAQLWGDIPGAQLTTTTVVTPIFPTSSYPLPFSPEASSSNSRSSHSSPNKPEEAKLTPDDYHEIPPTSSQSLRSLAAEGLKMKLKELCEIKHYAFSITRSAAKALSIECHIESAENKEIETELSSVINSLKQGLDILEIQDSQYQLNQSLNKRSLQIIGKAPVLNQIVQFLIEAGVAYLPSVTQTKAALFYYSPTPKPPSIKEDKQLEKNLEENTITCLTQ